MDFFFLFWYFLTYMALKQFSYCWVVLCPPCPCPVDHSGPKLTFALWIASGIAVARLVLTSCPAISSPSVPATREPLSLRVLVLCIISSLFKAYTLEKVSVILLFQVWSWSENCQQFSFSPWPDAVYKWDSLSPLQGPSSFRMHLVCW